jgi:hypothetical protein
MPSTIDKQSARLDKFITDSAKQLLRMNRQELLRIESIKTDYAGRRQDWFATIPKGMHEQIERRVIALAHQDIEDIASRDTIPPVGE